LKSSVDAEIFLTDGNDACVLAAQVHFTATSSTQFTKIVVSFRSRILSFSADVFLAEHIILPVNIFVDLVCSVSSAAALHRHVATVCVF
jgi:hypothetical protein